MKLVMTPSDILTPHSSGSHNRTHCVKYYENESSLPRERRKKYRWILSCIGRKILSMSKKKDKEKRSIIGR